MNLKIEDLAKEITLDGTKYTLFFNGGNWYTYKDNNNVACIGIETRNFGTIRDIGIYCDSNNKQCKLLKYYIDFMRTIKQVKKDFAQLQKIIKNNNNDFNTLCKELNGYKVEETMFDFAYGGYGIFTYTKDKGLCENIEIWFDNGFWNNYSLTEINKAIKNKGIDYWNIFQNQCL